MNLNEMTIRAAASAMARGEFSAEELTESALRRIKETQPAINAYITVMEERALEQARAVDRKRRAGEKLPLLAGVPGAIKDNICINGVRTTCASRMLENFVPMYDATVIERLDENDAVYVGKTNMDEFAMGSSNETSFFGPVSNPYDTERIPGGSSGGSAAAIAAQTALFALGSDTGGSIRQPGALCGTVAIKPTYGRVSRYGLVAFASSLDQIGVFAKTTDDCAVVLNAICGGDKKDSTSLFLEKEDFTADIGRDVKGLRIGLPRLYFGEGISAETREAVLAAAKEYEKQGAIVDEFDLDLARYALPVYYLISSAEASSNLGRFDGVRYGFREKSIRNFDEFFDKTRNAGYGEEVKRRIMLGTYVLRSGYYDAYYVKAQKVRTLIKREYDRALSKYDVLLTPVSPTTAWKKGEKSGDALSMYASDVCTVSLNIAGLPGLVLPCAYDKNGLPIGMQLIGRALDEKKLFRVGAAFEKDFHGKTPEI
ncbi:MAG: Asp-tRNA(Asn)/Glu-tRNA(Gln) amidotransferase subunit GatA [Eubacteriales bacterium]|nr:Asp-tRNA(Asn)/Glu-tRNA(Gln) amidotransferase subunit GatA [Eubacteriales bacterium]